MGTTYRVIDGAEDGLKDPSPREAVFDSLKPFTNYSYCKEKQHQIDRSLLIPGRLGMATHMPRKVLEKLGMGALLHDIGKSSIPADVLNKQGRLTNTEYRSC